jgi:hypothetical protein
MASVGGQKLNLIALSNAQQPWQRLPESTMSNLLLSGIVLFAGLGAWAQPAAAGLLSGKGPVIAILAGDRFEGEAEGRLDGSGTVWIQSLSRPDLTCRGQFTSSAKLGGVGSLKCSDGVTVNFNFQRLTLRRGYGAGSSSRGPLTFTYGLSPAESLAYLKLPPG